MYYNLHCVRVCAIAATMLWGVLVAAPPSHATSNGGLDPSTYRLICRVDSVSGAASYSLRDGLLISHMVSSAWLIAESLDASNLGDKVLRRYDADANCSSAPCRTAVDVFQHLPEVFRGSPSELAVLRHRHGANVDVLLAVVAPRLADQHDRETILRKARANLMAIVPSRPSGASDEIKVLLRFSRALENEPVGNKRDALKYWLALGNDVSLGGWGRARLEALGCSAPDVLGQLLADSINEIEEPTVAGKWHDQPGSIGFRRSILRANSLAAIWFRVSETPFFKTKFGEEAQGVLSVLAREDNPNMPLARPLFSHLYSVAQSFDDRIETEPAGLLAFMVMLNIEWSSKPIEATKAFDFGATRPPALRPDSPSAEERK